MKNRKRFKEIFPVIILLICAISLISVFGLIEKLINRMDESSELLSYTETGDNRVYYNQQWYEPNDALESLLVMGIDTTQAEDKEQGRFAQADFISLIVIDKENESFRILHINRDTMTDISQIDENGTEYGIYNAQLALAHTYGAQGKMQCRNTVKAVENLLYGIEIDHYISFTMDAVPIINDSLGGVEVKLSSDFPVLGEDYTAGSSVTLHGQQALTFVRWRSSDPTHSNLERMERQKLYVNALFEKYTRTNHENTLEAMLELSEYMVSDCSTNQLSTLAERLESYELKDTIELAGNAVVDDGYVEYYIDESFAQKTVIELFYKNEE